MMPLLLSPKAISRCAKVLGIVLFTLLCGGVWAQKGGVSSTKNKDKRALELQRIQHQKEIEQTRRLLAQTAKKSKANLAYLAGLDKVISEQSTMLVGMEGEVSMIQSEVDRSWDITQALQADLEKARESYAQLLYNLYTSGVNEYPLGYLISSPSLEDAARRARIIKFYTDFRVEQMELIYQTELALHRRIDTLSNQKREGEVMLSIVAQEREKLVDDKDEKTAIALQLQKDEKKYKAQLRESTRRAKQLDKAIRDIIDNANRPTARSTTKPKPGTAPVSTSPTSNTPEGQGFLAKKGSMGWPVKGGVIVEHYGTHAHPVYKHITIESHGVKFSAPEGSNVLAVADGKVSKILSIPGGGESILVKHGEYYTVYTGLSGVSVSPGDEIKGRTVLGTVGEDPSTGASGVGLQVWHGHDRLNPEAWLGSRP